MRGVALGGFMGTGKSTVGRILAERLGLPFVDTDAVLVDRHGPIAEQFAREGETTFRAREAALCRELAARPASVIATGGGLWVAASNRAALRSVADLVVLDAPFAVLAERVTADGARPLWDPSVQARYASRRPAYDDHDLLVDVSTRTPDDAVEEVLAWRTSQ